ncbi:hypothetical protein ACWDE0_07115 [Streptomyces sp. 900105755]
MAEAAEAVPEALLALGEVTCVQIALGEGDATLDAARAPTSSTRTEPANTARLTRSRSAFRRRQPP